MMDKSVLKFGGVAAVVGSVVSVAGNVLHPRASGTTITDELELVSGSEIWLLDHFLLILGIGLTFVGLVVIARSFDDEPAASWGRVALSAAVLGAAIGAATVFIDGMGNQAAATEWASKPDPGTFGSASAVATVSLSLFTGLMFTTFGLTPLLFGVAGLASRQYPKWLGYLALLAGLLGILAGSIQFLAGFSALTANILFPIGSIAFALWTLLMGMELWKRATRSTESVPEAAVAS